MNKETIKAKVLTVHDEQDTPEQTAHKTAVGLVHDGHEPPTVEAVQEAIDELIAEGKL